MIRGLLFLEDRAQEQFVVSLIQKLLSNYRLLFRPDIRSSTGGASVWGHLRQFAQDLRAEDHAVEMIDMLVVAVDGNCKGFPAVANSIADIIQPTGLLDKSILCVPEPHIEKWYLLDLRALRKTIDTRVSVRVPAHKCERDYYKALLGRAVAKGGSLLGGPEYGSEIASRMDIARACRLDGSFAAFVEQVCRRAASFKKTGN